MTLEGRYALVTGAGQGIGKATALLLAREGADVAVADINGEAVESTWAEITESGRRSIAIRADMGDMTDIERVVTDTVRGLGGVDILVNNAAITWHRQFMEITEDDWDRIHRVNAKGAFFCMQRCARQMIEQGRGGRIINVSSLAGQGWAGTSNAAYAASKGAVISMTRIGAHSLGSHDINVNAICPGVTSTPLFDNMIAKRSKDIGVAEDELRRRIIDSIPMHRLSEAEDIAAMAVFLAGPGGRNVAGQCLNVDGGLIMH
ncbi:MAG: glucose 1-dehydrogenase [Gammaproteobacteria bacterium]|nr:glucose 1-dehydrogenase [Gammaproteobacteria bacterium]NIV49720.1 glucose 1-dehydrogenase [Gammaproteobacteria bacterium]NIW57118.1 glucose 1-dehydrogenase [Gammaproteobacteria bacterium]